MFGSLGFNLEMDVLFLGRRQHVGGEVEVVDPLHDDDRDALLFVIVAGGEGVTIDRDLRFDVRRGRFLLGLVRIVDDDVVAAQAGAGAGHGGREHLPGG
jgi:hypothetical protein